MRIAIVYDCLFPNTVGGAERWYRSLAERLQASGHDVTYLTRVQWDAEGPETPFPTIAVSRAEPLYTESGRRRIGEALRFGWGVFRHMLRHGQNYDVVHTNVFPHFALIGGWLATRLRGRRKRPKLVVDWFELWTHDYWIAYVGPVAGRIGYAVQRLCTRLPDQSFVFSALHERRLVEQGHRAPTVRLRGIFQAGETAGSTDAGIAVRPRGPQIVFAGRHIPEKQVTTIPNAVAEARRTCSDLRCIIFGDGPTHTEVTKRVRELRLSDVISMPGHAPFEEVQSAIGSASCLVLPSIREGFGLVVVEAASLGTPAVVVAGPDNAAVELVDDGINGYVAPSADAGPLGDAIVKAVEGGPELRNSTLEWYRAHADELSIDSSLAIVERSYRGAAA